ncbi:MAG TPA: protein-disulfide reductase DsbD family protein [Kiritimatiellia bacterium]|nr:protein-disulfide reductase DsbD family protein [Kiritimatiellia bacterium]HRZ11248.1 protein-disulfide reductase DsbD family protein [Kiritimatiellia bacterium]HSA19099.1 protein-disulfide reductase DsbD family protein [Kiritimatiellia bacterium]
MKKAGWLGWVAIVLAGAGTAAAAPVRARHSEAELTAEQAAIRAGETVWLALAIRLDPGWHTYWLNPGDSGMAPRLAWSLPEGFSAGALAAPPPARFESEGLVSLGYGERVVFLVPITAPAGWGGGPATVGLKATWLVCSDLCLPESATFSLELNGAAAAAPEGLFAEARARLPLPPDGWTLRALRRGREVHVSVEPPAGSGAESPMVFFPARADEFTYDTATVPQQGPALRLQISPLAETFPEKLMGVLVAHGTALALDIPIETPVEAEGVVP